MLIPRDFHLAKECSGCEKTPMGKKPSRKRACPGAFWIERADEPFVGARWSTSGGSGAQAEATKARAAKRSAMQCGTVPNG